MAGYLFVKISNINFHQSLFIRSRELHAYGQTDQRRYFNIELRSRLKTVGIGRVLLHHWEMEMHQ
jgi:hypothetical protein